jgi:hypothetical protein
MALNFPNSPALDEVYTTPDGSSFIWNGVQWVGFSSSVILVQNTVPLTVEDNATIVGTGITSINFGNYLGVTYNSNRVTVDVNTIWTEVQSGIYRLSDVGIGTTNPRFKLEVGAIGYGGTALYVNGGINNTGMVTFTTAADSDYDYRGYITIGGEDINTGLTLGYRGNKGNIIFGKRSGFSLDSTARRNVFIGEETGSSFTNLGSSDNVFVGAYAGNSYADSNNNVFIGNGVGYNPSNSGLTGSYNVMIGPTGADGDVFDVNPDSVLKTPPIVEGSHQLVIGAGNTAWLYGNNSFYVGIGTNAAEEKLHVDGGLKVTGVTTSGGISVGLGYTYIGINTSGINLHLNQSNESTQINFYSYYAGEDPHVISLLAPDESDNYTLRLPTNNGSQYDALTSDGDGNLSWAYPSKWYPTSTGIHTTSSVSVGTNIPVATLTVSGDAYVSGALTATSFRGEGSSITGIVTTLVAGTNVSISTSYGQVTVNALLSEPLYWNPTVTGIHTTSKVGIGTTNATSELTVRGRGEFTNLSVSGVGTITTLNIATGIVTSLTASSGIITSFTSTDFTSAFSTTTSLTATHASTTNLSAGIATATTLNVGTAGTVIRTTDNGFVGVGTTTPTARLSVGGSLSIIGISTFYDLVRVGEVGLGLGSTAGALIYPSNGQIVSNNTGISGGIYLRTSGTNRWYVDYQSNQFNTGKIEVGPTVSSPETVIYNSGNAQFSGIVTAATLADSKGDLRTLPQNARASAYVLVKLDVGKHVAISTGGVTIPQGIFATGDVVTVYNNSDAVQMLTPAAGVTLRRAAIGDTGSRGLNSYALATILCVGTNSFALTGAGIT